MATPGITVNKQALIERLEAGKTQVKAEAVAKLKRDKEASEADRKSVIIELTERLAAAKGKRLPKLPTKTGNYYSYSNQYAASWTPYKADDGSSLRRTLDELDKAIRVISMSLDTEIRLGPKMISDLGLSRWL